jgi:hypothetical protein
MSDTESDGGDWDRLSLIKSNWMGLLDKPISRAIIEATEDCTSDILGKLLMTCLSDHVASQRVKFDKMLELATNLRRKNTALTQEFEDFVACVRISIFIYYTFPTIFPKECFLIHIIFPEIH